jgi:hypothetical protein
MYKYNGWIYGCFMRKPTNSTAAGYFKFYGSPSYFMQNVRFLIGEPSFPYIVACFHGVYPHPHPGPFSQQ